MAARYNRLGMATVNFDYYGCGYSEGDFSDFTLSGAVTDLRTVLNWVREQPFADPARVIIHGQSLGTAIATVACVARDDIRGFVFWNQPAHGPHIDRRLLPPAQ